MTVLGPARRLLAAARALLGPARRCSAAARACSVLLAVRSSAARPGSPGARAAAAVVLVACSWLLAGSSPGA
jgi:hypothetical protein